MLFGELSWNNQILWSQNNWVKLGQRQQLWSVCYVFLRGFTLSGHQEANGIGTKVFLKHVTRLKLLESKSNAVHIPQFKQQNLQTF